MLLVVLLRLTKQSTVKNVSCKLKLTRLQRFSSYHLFSSRSFVPPVRDEESETQRKAHAKRVRETRRSTQGVTLEDLKSAEQLVKKKQQLVSTMFLQVSTSD